VHLVEEVNASGMEVALDYALQCSPTILWVAEHPEWFPPSPGRDHRLRRESTKVYQDIYPPQLLAPTEPDRAAMWEACKGILDYWISLGVRIFPRGQSAHQADPFLEWVIAPSARGRSRSRCSWRRRSPGPK